jgi:CDGSH-type Zn-finger protein
MTINVVTFKNTIASLKNKCLMENKNKPVVAGTAPIVVELEPGTYAWCSCGQSSNQPWCDGRHSADGKFAPVVFKVEAAKTVALCTCKHSATPQFCDGSHRQL